MTRISGPTTSRPAAGGATRTARGRGFSLPEQAAAALIGGDGQVAAAAAAEPPSAILGLQEVDPPGLDLTRDRQARQDAGAMLDLLGTLQRDLLAEGGSSRGVAARLGALVDAPVADDPGLAAIQRAIACRAAVELARRGGMPPDDMSMG